MTAETIPYLMGPFGPSAIETIADIDSSMSTEIEFSNENDFFQVQTTRQHYPMAAMDVTNTESGVHTPVLMEDDAVDMLENSGGDWRMEDGASKFSGYCSTSSTLAMKRQEDTEWTSPPAKKKTHRRSHYTFVGN